MSASLIFIISSPVRINIALKSKRLRLETCWYFWTLWSFLHGLQRQRWAQVGLFNVINSDLEMHVLRGIIRVAVSARPPDVRAVEFTFSSRSGWPLSLLYWLCGSLMSHHDLSIKVTCCCCCCCYIKQTFKKFQRRKNNYCEGTHRWEVSETGKSVNWLFSSFFSRNTHGSFLCCFSIFLTYYLHIMASSEFFFFLLQEYFLFSPLPLCLSLTIRCSHFFVFLSSDSWGGDQVSLPHAS